MTHFTLNSYTWTIIFVNPYSRKLIDRTEKLTVATTDPLTRTIYLSDELYGSFLVKVLIHEIAHCALFSFGLIPYIHKVVKPMYWIDAEEWLCNYLADYGVYIFKVAYEILGEDALSIVPLELERLIA